MKYTYQIVAVLNPKTEEKDKILNKINSMLEEKSATVVKKDHMGSKDLVYKIKDQSRGDFWIFDVESEKSLQIKDLNVYLNRENNIIRYLILKK